MRLNKITFPLYKIRSYISINKNPLGLVKITTIKGTYILDDTSINKPFEDRRLQLMREYPYTKIYKLRDKIIYLRQLVKYKTGTKFIDYNGQIIKYIKSTKQFNITSHKIVHKRDHKSWSIITVQGLETPFIIGEKIKSSTTHASIMHTKWGPFLYDLTNRFHETYRRKI
jgi:hypothetical protein